MGDEIMNNFKVNRFISLLKLPSDAGLTQPSPSPSPPTDLIGNILFYLHQWLASLSTTLDQWFPGVPDFFSSCFSTLQSWFANINDVIPPGEGWLHAVAHWLTLAAPFLICGALLLLVLYFCLRVVVSCIRWIFNVVCCSRRRSGKMMVAPGSGGAVMISRSAFESDPAAYFRNLRAPIILR